MTPSDPRMSAGQESQYRCRLVRYRPLRAKHLTWLGKSL